MSIGRHFRLGLDFIDVLLHVVATCFVMLVWVTLEPIGFPSETAAALTGAVSAILLMIRRQRALAGAPEETPAAGVRAELEERIRALELSQDRLLELEERLDFAERLLAQQPAEPERLRGA